MDFTKSNRDKNTLKPLALKAYELFVKECKKQNVNIFPTDFLRTKERQWYLYCKGRTIPQAVRGGVPEYFAKEWSSPKEGQVTWTLNSNHMSGMAWDMACNPPQDLYDANILKKANNIAENLGLKHGGSYGDSPHFECPTDWREPIMEENKQVPQWQVAAFKNMVNKLELDKEYWTEDKVGEPITKGELFAVLDKMIRNMKVEVKL